MKLKTYLCDSMDQALQTIRDELGPDAVIISSMNEDKKVRVTAACENPPHAPIDVPKETRVYSELETKNALCHLLSYHKVPAESGDAIITRTCKLDTKVFESGLAGVFDDLFSFKPIPLTCPDNQPQQIMLAGQVGVGKTVTLAKIASEYTLQNKPVEIISADYLKAGATEQIQIYADALKVPLTLVETPEQLESKLSTNKPGVTYLIDTPGTNVLNRTEVDILTNFILAAKQAPYLVLPAGSDAYELKDIASAFKDLGCTKFIMTRFDASKRLGGLLTILQDENLELVALSHGPEIGSRLKLATPEFVVSFFMKHLPEMLATHERVHDLLPKPKSKGNPHKNTSSIEAQNGVGPTNTKLTQPLPAWVKSIKEA